MFIVIRLINKSPRSLLFADNEIKLKLFSCFPTRSLALHEKKSTNLWRNGNKNKKLFAIKTSSLPDFLQSARCDGPAAVKLFVNSAISLCHWTLFDAALMPSAHSHSYFYDIAFAQLLILFFSLRRSSVGRLFRTWSQHSLTQAQVDEKNQCPAICQSVFMFLFSQFPNALFASLSLSRFARWKCVSMCFRSHIMLQQMIIFDGDDAGTGYNETGKRGEGKWYESESWGDKLKQ